ncbi:MAG: hypothetical protein DRP30_03595 [Thermotoga sp.]|nr:MAG: hypothetical protein DRP30_03595 [Thermotoga sp.]HDM70280.1 hypothetical protein [Thermotogales bacterium]
MNLRRWRVWNFPVVSLKEHGNEGRDQSMGECDLNVGISTVAFKDVKNAIEFHRETGIPMEYSVNLSVEDVERLILEKIPALSVHVPSPNEGFLPNFASDDPEVLKKSFDILRNSVETLKKTMNDGFTEGIIVLHPGYALNELVPSIYSERKVLLESKISKYEKFLIERSGIINGPEYLETDDYRRHFEIFVSNLPKLIEIVENEGFTLAIENLNPRLFYILQTPDEIYKIIENVRNVHLCLDISHLWVSSKVMGFDYFETVRRIMDTDRVVHVHVSNNPSKKGLYEDPHLDLDSGEIDMKLVLKNIIEGSRNINLVLEVKKNPLKNLEMLREMLRMGCETPRRAI